MSSGSHEPRAHAAALRLAITVTLTPQVAKAGRAARRAASAVRIYQSRQRDRAVGRAGSSRRRGPRTSDQGDGTPLAGASGWVPLTVVTAPAGLSSVVRTGPFGTSTPFLMTAMYAPVTPL